MIIKVFSGKAKKITATNQGKVAITLTGAQITGSFAISKDCSASLQPKKKCTYSVVFAPVAAGASSGVLTIDNNSSSGPQTVSLSGTGQQSAKKKGDPLRGRPSSIGQL